MPLGDLLNSTNTTEEGRVIINDAYTRACLWTGRTETTSNLSASTNIIAVNSGTNTISSMATIFGYGPGVDKSSILGGNNNEINSSSAQGYVQNCSIIGGSNNTIESYGSAVFGALSALTSSVVVGGNNNNISPAFFQNCRNVAILGSDNKVITTNTFNTTFADNLFSTGGRIKKVRKITIGGATSGDWVPPSGGLTAPNIIEPDDEIIYITNNSGGFFAPLANSWCIDIGSFINSEDGRCVEIIVKNVFTNFGKGFGISNTPIGLGYPLATIGTRFLNRVAMASNTKSATICESQAPLFTSLTGLTNFLHVKLVITRDGNDGYIAMGGTGAP